MSETPTCTICDAPLIRRPGEQLGHYRSRKTCSEAHRYELMRQRLDERRQTTRMIICDDCGATVTVSMLTRRCRPCAEARTTANKQAARARERERQEGEVEPYLPSQITEAQKQKLREWGELAENTDAIPCLCHVPGAVQSRIDETWIHAGNYCWCADCTTRRRWYATEKLPQARISAGGFAFRDAAAKRIQTADELKRLEAGR